MDFDLVLETVSGFLEKRGSCCALIGGLGMAAYGMARTTLDLDIVAPYEVQKDLVAFLEGKGYKTLYVSEGYSNHLHDDPAMGRIDIVYVRGKTERILFEESRTIEIANGRQVKVLRPEHLIAMKVFAIKNNRSREFHDMADIMFLMELPGIDSAKVKEYFVKQGVEDLYDRIMENRKRSRS